MTTDEEAAVQQDGFVSDPSEEVQLVAIHQNCDVNLPSEINV